MGQARRDLHLAQEPLRLAAAGGILSQKLDGDAAVVLEVPGKVDRGHPAPADLFLDPIAPGQAGAERFESVGHE